MGFKFENLLLVAVVGAFGFYIFKKRESRKVPQVVTDVTPAKVEVPIAKPRNVDATINQIMTRYNAGDFGASLKLADQALANPKLSAASKKWIKDQLPVILSSLGWFHIKGSQCRKAIPLLLRASKFRSTAPELKGLSYCYYRLKDYASANVYFPQFLEISPKDLDMIKMYIDSLESEYRFLEALDLVEAKMREYPDDKIFAQLYESINPKVEEGLRQAVTTSHRINLSYRPDIHEDIVVTVIEMAESAIDDLIETYGFAEPRASFEVLLYADPQYRQVVQSSPDWAGGVFDGKIRLKVGSEMNEASLKRLVRHELVHALFADQLDYKTIPTWFNEGIAQLAECETPCPPDFFSSSRGGFLPVQDFMGSFASYSKPKAERSYAQSYYLTLALINQAQKGGFFQPLFKIISPLKPSSALDSGSLLNPVKVDFNQLYAFAKAKWQESASLLVH